MDNQEFQILKDVVQPDSRGRVSLGMTATGKTYRALINDEGQILLDPVVPVPERELWLWKNPEAIESIQRGIQEAKDGKAVSIESFAKYAEIDLEND